MMLRLLSDEGSGSAAYNGHGIMSTIFLANYLVYPQCVSLSSSM